MVLAEYEGDSKSEFMAWSCSQKYASAVDDQASADAHTSFVNYSGLAWTAVENASGTPDTLLASNRVTADKSPWKVRHNFSFIKSNPGGSTSYGWDNTGHYAFCFASRPFSNVDSGGVEYPGGRHLR